VKRPEEIRKWLATEPTLEELQVRHQMALAAVRRLSLSAATGVTDGRVRFNFINGWIAQKLLFEHGLVASRCRCAGSGCCGRCCRSAAS
jgi:hypothetical protein